MKPIKRESIDRKVSGINLRLEGPFKIADLRAGKWRDVPKDSGAYRWYFPAQSLKTLGIAEHCDLGSLRFHETDDGMVGLYFGIALSLSQRVKWHAAQPLRISALRSGFLSTYRFSLLALTSTDYRTGEETLNIFMDQLKIAWITTSSREDAEQIEASELAGDYHYPINIQNNYKPEVAPFVKHLSALRREYKRKYLNE